MMQSYTLDPRVVLAMSVSAPTLSLEKVKVSAMDSRCFTARAAAISYPSAIRMGWMPLSRRDSACSSRAPANTKIRQILTRPRLKNEKNLKKDQNSITKTSDCEQQIRKRNFIRIKNTVPLSSSVCHLTFFSREKNQKKILTNNTGRPVPNLIVLGFRELHHEFGNFVGWPHLLHDRSAVVGDGDITVRSHENFVETCREKKHPEISFQIQVLDVRAQKDYLLARGMCEECSKRFSRP